MKPLHLRIVLILIAISTALLGLSMLLIGPHRHITLTTDFYLLTDLLPANTSNIIAAVTFLGCAVLSILAINKANLRPWLGYLLMVISLVPLGSLFASTMWIEALGGFPVIGSGQGVIKYFALLSIAWFLIKPNLSGYQAAYISLFPVLLVLLWIGGMKFTLFEAQGIEGLVNSSPLMSWMYSLWELQTVSNLIGVYDLVAVLLLIIAIYKRELLYPALLMSGAVFVVTQTFLFSFSGSLSSATILSTTGHFLVKDLWFLANLICFYAVTESIISKQEKQ